MITHVSIDEVEYIIYEYAKDAMDYDEPFASFEIRYPGRLESCLAQPFQTFDGIDLYPTLTDKAAILFYLMIKDHPFENGNKRMALLVLIVFLFRNGYWLKATNKEIYNFACRVSESGVEEREEIVDGIKVFVESKIRKRRLVMR